MTTSPLSFELVAPAAKSVPFAGAEYEPERDKARLTRQVDCICAVTLGAGWLTLQQITAACRKRFAQVRFPENSVQAQLRNLRKVGYTVDRKNIAEHGSLYAYKVSKPEVSL